MASVQVASLEPGVYTVVRAHQQWMRSTTYRPFMSGRAIEIGSDLNEMQIQSAALVFHFRSLFGKGDRVVAFRFEANATFPVDPGWAYDIIPVTGPIRLNGQIVPTGKYAHIDQTSSLEAVSPPHELVRCCWLLMHQRDGKSTAIPSLQTEIERTTDGKPMAIPSLPAGMDGGG